MVLSDLSEGAANNALLGGETQPAPVKNLMANSKGKGQYADGVDGGGVRDVLRRRL